jgi:uncharacterized membrane protein YcaP (DUF421 family)
MNVDLIGLLEVAARTLVVYAAIVIGLRLMGKRELGQMTVFDLVVLLLVANAVQNAMVGADTSLAGGLVAAAVLLVVNRGVAALRLHGRWGRVLEGVPRILVHGGRFDDIALRREGVGRDEVEMAMREHGLADLSDVRLAVLETDGTISIVPETAAVLRSRRRVRQLRH